MYDLPVHDITSLPKPSIGNKGFLIDRPGIFILERGPVIFQAMANTHQGTGCVKVFNGVPNDKGHFVNAPDTPELLRNGRMLFNANPPILGMWMFAIELDHGLTIEVSGVMGGIGPTLTVVYMPKAVQKRQIV